MRQGQGYARKAGWTDGMPDWLEPTGRSSERAGLTVLDILFEWMRLALAWPIIILGGWPDWGGSRERRPRTPVQTGEAETRAASDLQLKVCVVAGGRPSRGSAVMKTTSKEKKKRPVGEQDKKQLDHVKEGKSRES